MCVNFHFACMCVCVCVRCMCKVCVCVCVSNVYHNHIKDDMNLIKNVLFYY